MAQMISQLDFEAKRRRNLADILSKGVDNPISSNFEGLSKILREGVAGYQNAKAGKAEAESKRMQGDVIAGVISGKTPREEGMAQLAQIPAYQDVALKAALEKPKFEGLKDQAEQALFAQASGQQLTPEQTAALTAYDKLRSTELMYDPRQNIVSKYASLLQAPSGAGAAPIPAQGNPQPVAAPAGDMPPQPTLGGKGPLLPPPADMPQGATRQPFQMPAGLDAKAQGQFMDAMAQDAAKRAANGGVPDLTERQGKASSFAGRMEQAEAEIENILKSDPTYQQSNVIDNLAGAYLPAQIRNIATSQTGQTLRAAQENWITGVLRLDSGAQIPAQEMNSYVAQYFPAAGDNQATIEQKARARKAAMEAVKAEAGAGYGFVTNNLENQGLGKALQPATPQAGGGLTPQEQAEYEQLKRMFGGQ